MSIQAPNTAPPDQRPTPPPRSPERRRGPSTGAITLGLVLIAIGVVALLVTLGVDVPLRAVGPAILVLVGIGVVVSAVRGEPDGGGLGLAIFLGIVLAAASFVGAGWDVPLAGGVGDRVHEPTTVQVLDEDYRMAVGDLTVDLRDMDFEAGTTELEVSILMGQVEVIVPDGLAVTVDAQVAAGTADVLGHRVDGVGVDNDRRTDDWDDADQRLSLTVRVGLGEAVVAVR